ncbi:MAG: choice-of-anchor D domain-containing protein, partial [Pseudomonadota bacterium]|nr:choice-of-anchor D domain-containing protein [Pseudomonadota bacterium]
MSNACESGLASDLTLDDSGNIYIAMTGFYDDNGLICSLNNNLEFIQLKEYESLEPSAITINGTDNTFFITDLLTDNVSKVGIEPSIWFNLDHNSLPLSNPKSIAFDPNNNFVYVSDTYVDNAGKSRIQKFNSEGNYISEWSTNAPGTGIAVDEEGYVYVAQKDNNLIQVFDSEGGLLTQWGAARINDESAVVDPTASTLMPNDIAVDVTTKYRIAYVTDTNNKSIYAFAWSFLKPSVSNVTNGGTLSNVTNGGTFDFSKVLVGEKKSQEFRITADPGITNLTIKPIKLEANYVNKIECVESEPTCFVLEVDATNQTGVTEPISFNENEKVLISYEYTLDDIPFKDTYSFSVKGSIEPPKADIKVFVDANNNEKTYIPATDGSFNFGTHNLGDNVVRTFTVENVAGATADLKLKLDSWDIPASVILEEDFSLNSVIPGATATFKLKLDTSQVINNNNTIGKISFSYNDGIKDKDLDYIIDLLGTVQLPPEKPDIQVSINSIPQKTGNVFDFNNTPIGTDVIKTLTLKNIGEQPLILSSPPTFEQGRAFSFIETLEATETVNLAKNKEKSYQIKLDASTQGQFEDTLIIQSNDEDEGHYSIIVKGSVGDQPQQPAVTVTPRPNVGGIYLLPPERDLSISFEGNGQGYVEGFKIKRVSSVQELELQYIDCDADVDNNQHDVCQYTFKTASKIKLTATPLPGSRFVAWEGRKCPEDGQIPVLVENIECIAHFTLDKAQLTVSTTGKGQVTSRPNGIQCGSQDKQCQQEFNGDTEITLVALPDLGWHFSGWQGDCDAGGSVSLKADSHCQAVFEPVKHPEYTLLIDVLGQGWVAAEGINQCTTTCQKDYHHELRVTLTATPKAGMIFNYWGGDCSGTAPTTQVVMDAVKRCTAAFSLPCPQTEIIYVNQAAQGNNNGCSWTHAFNELSTALKQVKQLPQVKQIWVAQGVYKPTSTTDRQATFQLINGVSIYGGFAGSETELRQRDTLVYPTILSGDIGQPHELSDNSYHVVTGYATDASAVLDGFIISDGNATEGDSCPHACGGGLLNHQGSPTIRYSLFKNNTAHYGGGLFNDYQSQATIKYCFFNDNFAEEGGGIANHNSSPRISHVVINNNVATHAGGGMINFNNSQPVLTHVNLTANVATTGGGLFNNHSSPLISHSMLADNMAAQGGGIANVNNSQPFLSHLVLSGNTVSDSGGALFNEHSQPFISQATISGNVAVNGGGIVNVASQLTVNNTILWNNTDSF